MKINNGSISFVTRLYEPWVRCLRIVIGPLMIAVELADEDRDYDHLKIADALRALATKLDEIG